MVDIQNVVLYIFQHYIENQKFHPHHVFVQVLLTVALYFHQIYAENKDLKGLFALSVLDFLEHKYNCVPMLNQLLSYKPTFPLRYKAKANELRNLLKKEYYEESFTKNDNIYNIFANYIFYNLA